jgi:SAM-dependent methyltransferase
MSSYIGRHAELYDFFYADKPYADEALFVHRCLQRYGSATTNRLLELACGTGSHAFALAEFGYQILATDYSADMLEIARRKAHGRASAIEFRLQDMTQLADPELPYDAVVCLFDSIGYVATNEKISQVLRGVHGQLRDGGLFIFEFWHGAAMLRGYDPLRVRRWQTAQGELLRISETRLDCARQVSHVTYRIYEFKTGGIYSTLTETQVNRYFLLQEMAYWLTCAGFTPVKYFAGFTEDESINEDTWHVVAVARRDGAPGQPA